MNHFKENPFELERYFALYVSYSQRCLVRVAENPKQCNMVVAHWFIPV